MIKIIWKNKDKKTEYNILIKDNKPLNSSELDALLKDIYHYLKFRADTLCRQHNVLPAYYEDILQKFLIKVLYLIPKYNNKKSSFKTFIHFALNNYFKDIFRSKKNMELFGKTDFSKFTL